MKRFFYTTVITFILFLSSCELETSDNGKLDGFWHLERIDTLSTGGVKDLAASRLFWSFQGKMMMVSDKDSRNAECILRFENRGDSLLLYNPILSDRTHGDVVITDSSILNAYGINKVEERFRLEELSHSKMSLTNHKYRLFLRKF